MLKFYHSTSQEPHQLLPGQVDIWPLELPTQAPWQTFFHLLSCDERLKAARFMVDRDRHKYIVGRGVLRAILGTYLDQAPQDLALGINSLGKPFLIEAPHLQFNLSHSGNMVLYALSRDIRVGIDLEWMHPDIDIPAVASLTLSLKEQSILASLSGDAQLSAFLTFWTRKEASLKALGGGLTHTPFPFPPPFGSLYTFPLKDYIATLCTTSPIASIYLITEEHIRINTTPRL